jgi:hypothetical protein
VSVGVAIVAGKLNHTLNSSTSLSCENISVISCPITHPDLNVSMNQNLGHKRGMDDEKEFRDPYKFPQDKQIKRLSLPAHSVSLDNGNFCLCCVNMNNS